MIPLLTSKISLAGIRLLHLLPGLPQNAIRPHTHDELILVCITIVTLALMAGSGVWAFVARTRGRNKARALTQRLARAQRDIAFREAMIAASPEAIVVLGFDMASPLSYRGGTALLQTCLEGPNGSLLAGQINALLERGEMFNQVAVANGNIISLRGQPVGKYAAIFLRAEPKESLQLEPATLATYQEAFDQARDAIALFEPDGKLALSNLAFAQLWQLPQSWLSTAPVIDSIIDRLREEGRLPEQPDYHRWKHDFLAAFHNDAGVPEQIWHLASGKSLRVTAHRRANGGLAYRFEDITESLSQRSTYAMLVKNKKALLDKLTDDVAVFGPDGRLRLCNIAFALKWQLSDEEAAASMHLRDLAHLCATRIGRDNTWDIVASAIASDTPEMFNEWSTIMRQDGAVLSLALSRLPDGATLMTTTDLTDLVRFEDAFREQPRHVA